MSLSPYFYLERWNSKKNCYEKINLYRKAGRFASEKEKARGFEEVDFWPWNGTHDLFSLLGTASRSGDYDSIEGVHKGIPPMVSEEVKAKIDSFFDKDNLYQLGAEGSVCWITLADLYIEMLKHPKVVDYNEEWEEGEKKYKDTPIKELIDRIVSFIEFADDIYLPEENRSLIRLVYWVVW